MPVSQRDVRATTRALDEYFLRFRDAMEDEGASVEERRQSRAGLESEMADAKAAARLSKGSELDLSKLNERIFAVRTYLKDNKVPSKGSLPSVSASTVVSKVESRTNPKKTMKDRVEPRGAQAEDSFETRSVAASNASSARSVMERKHAIEREQFDEERRLRLEMREMEEKARDAQLEAQRAIETERERRREDIERRIMESRHRCEEAGAGIDDDVGSTSDKSDRTKKWVQNSDGQNDVVDSYSQSEGSYTSASAYINLADPSIPQNSDEVELAEDAGTWKTVEKKQKSAGVSKGGAVKKVAAAPIPKPRTKVKSPLGVSAVQQSRAPALTSTPVTAATSTPTTAPVSFPTPISAELGQNTDAAASFLNLQTKQLAFQYLVAKRPRVLYKKDGKMDFEHYMLEFESAIAIPGLTSELKLAELKFWWVGTPGLTAAKFTLRKDHDAALKEAIEELKEKFGRRRTSPEEMLDDLLVGAKIGPKDFDAVEEFIGKLEVTYQLAILTGRAKDFDQRRLFETILKVKLPHLKFKWLQKWSKNEEEKGTPLTFLNFISYLNSARKLSENIERCDRALIADRSEGRTPSTTVPSTPSTYTNARPGNGSSRRFTPAFENSTSTQFPTNRTKFLPSYKFKSEMKNENNDLKKNAFEMKNNGEAGYEARNQFYCLMCDQPHKLNDCPNFVSLNADERSTFCKNRNVCFKCLGAGHRATTCASKKGCLVCGLSHHGALHGAAMFSSLNSEASPFVVNHVSFAAKTTPASSTNQDSA